MPPTREIPPDLVVKPFSRVNSPVLFGVEHEYNYDPYGPSRVELPRGWAQHGEHCGWEIKTPPSRDVRAVMAEFRRIEAFMSERLGYPVTHRACGLHIHINVDPSKGPAANPVRFAELYLRHKPYLWSIVPNENGGVGRTTSRSYGAEQLAGPDQLRSFWNRHSHRGEINTGSMSGHGTIEIRLGAGTADMDAFELWLRTILALAAKAKYAHEDPIIDLADWIDVQRTDAGDILRTEHNYIAMWAGDPNWGLNRVAEVEALISSKRQILSLFPAADSVGAVHA